MSCDAGLMNVVLDDDDDDNLTLFVNFENELSKN